MGLARFYPTMPAAATQHHQSVHDFGDTEEFQQFATSLYDNGEDVEAYLEQLAHKAMSMDTTSALETLSPPPHLRSAWKSNPAEPEPSPFIVPSDSSSSSSSEISTYDVNGNIPFRLQLPIASGLAQRRFLARGEDLECVAREQFFSLGYAVRRRGGFITEPEALFGPVRWDAPEGTVEREGKGEEVSPRTRGRVSRRRWIGKGWRGGRGRGGFGGGWTMGGLVLLWSGRRSSRSVLPRGTRGRCCGRVWRVRRTDG